MFYFKDQAEHRITFDCHDCQRSHTVNESWKWNGNLHRITLEPSVLVHGMDFPELWERQYQALG